MAVGGSSVSEVREAESAASAVVDQGVLDATTAAVDPPVAVDSDSEPAASAVVDQGVLDSVAAAVDPPVAVGSDSDSDSDLKIENWNWMEMPPSTLRWVLAQTRESDSPVPTLEEHGIYTGDDLESKDPDKVIRTMIATRQAEQDDFFAFQAWVGEVFLRNGRVMVPEDGYQAWVRKVFLRSRCVMVLSEDEDVVGPKGELLKALDEAWGDDIQLVVDADPHATDTDDSSTKQVILLAPR